jgi:sugar/nucleoside kinase (ribokinase family)
LRRSLSNAANTARRFFTQKIILRFPPYPLESVFDPTGAGDTFAGGFMGYLAFASRNHRRHFAPRDVYGSVMASFNVEEFGTERVDRLTQDEINKRFREFKRITHFEEIPFEQATSA